MSNNLTSLVKDVTYFYIKYYYEQEYKCYPDLCVEVNDEIKMLDVKARFPSYFKNWYDFLGISTSGFIQQLDVWRRECKSRNIANADQYMKLCEKDKRFPNMPDEFYKGFTNIESELHNKNKLLTELCLKQRKKADKKYLLELNDLIRLLKNINTSIFNNNECVLWNGYLTKCNNNKSCYVNFYLKKRKLALHRILYINFIFAYHSNHKTIQDNSNY